MSEILSQNEIDSLLDGLDEKPNKRKRPSIGERANNQIEEEDESLSQADIDALLDVRPESSSNTKKPRDDKKLFTQDEIDDLMFESLSESSDEKESSLIKKEGGIKSIIE